jgi:hypothetical protein
MVICDVVGEFYRRERGGRGVGVSGPLRRRKKRAHQTLPKAAADPLAA